MAVYDKKQLKALGLSQAQVTQVGKAVEAGMDITTLIGLLVQFSAQALPIIMAVIEALKRK